MQFLELPTELILAVADQLESEGFFHCITRLSRTCRYLHHLLGLRLYLRDLQLQTVNFECEKWWGINPNPDKDVLSKLRAFIDGKAGLSLEFCRR